MAALRVASRASYSPSENSRGARSPFRHVVTEVSRKAETSGEMEEREEEVEKEEEVEREDDVEREEEVEQGDDVEREEVEKWEVEERLLRPRATGEVGSRFTSRILDIQIG